MWQKLLRAISIHALREEGDLPQFLSLLPFSDFYPRPPRGGRQAAASIGASAEEFLSTPSARRATCKIPIHRKINSNFYPRPPRGGRPTVYQRGRPPGLFLSTPSARRATQPHPAVLADVGISIHALREEGDRAARDKFRPAFRISIHALREEGDPAVYNAMLTTCKFLSTPSARRATTVAVIELCPLSYFYPRPPRGGRRRCRFCSALPSYFYPRPPRGGRQQKQRQNLYFLINYTTFCTNLEEP